MAGDFKGTFNMALWLPGAQTVSSGIFGIKLVQLEQFSNDCRK